MESFSIEGVEILDGTGAEPFAGSVTVEDGRIARVERNPPPPSHDSSSLVLPPSSLVLCPGFIDIHTHADIALLSNPRHEPKLLQGVTTEVFSNCGLGFCPCTSADALHIQREFLGGLFGDDTGVDWGWRTVGEYLNRLRHGIGTNAAYLFPHGAVRVSVMGMDAREADAAEVEAMAALAERSMEEGARGMSSGLWYAPMCYANEAELVALCRVVARYGGIWAVHLREYEDGVLDALEEAIRVADAAGVPLQVSHLQTNGRRNWGKSEAMLEAINRARARGVDVTADSYPYTAGSTMLQAMLPEWANAGGPSELRERLRNAEDRERIAAALASSPSVGPWEEYVLSGIQTRRNAAFEGRSIAACAAEAKVPPPELVVRLLIEEDLGACFIRHSQNEGDLRNFLRSPAQMVGSDGLHVQGKPHPRLWGTFPRVLAHYARDEGVITPQAAVHKMSGAPAARMGLSDRGVIREGAAADLVLLDWAALTDAATFDDPARPPEGIRAVWVNGRLAVEDRKAVGALNGRVL